MSKMDTLAEGSDERAVMEALFKLAAKQLRPTVGAMTDQNEKELKESLLELWDQDLIRWAYTEVERDDEPCFFLEAVHPDGTWKPVDAPVVH